MTIRQRISLLIVLMVVALMTIGSYAVYQSRQNAMQVRQVTDGVVPSALASADLVAGLRSVQLATMEMTYATDAEAKAQADEHLKASEASLRLALTQQLKGAAGQAQKGLVQEAGDSLDNYFAAIGDTAKMKAAGNLEMAEANLYANVAQYRDEMEGIVQTLRIEKNREKDAALVTLNSSLGKTARTITIVTLAVIVGLVAIAVLLYRQIVGPLSRMQSMMSEIAASQDFARRLPIVSADEVGRSMVAFNEMISKIDENSKLLKQKNQDIQAMLQNMQQGIATVLAGGLIHPEYSEHMRVIFETSDFAGRKLTDVVFTDAGLGADAIAQIEAAVDACVGEDSMNFLFNSHLFPHEIVRTMPDGRRKVLDLSWSAITDDADIITRLMVCVRDVTELRELAAEAGEQRQRLDIIGELLHLGQDKFDAFVDSATRFLNENEKIILEHPEASTAALDALFRNMHTVKGNARTYNLRRLTDVAHEVEQGYQVLRDGESAKAWAQDDLMEELVRVRATVEQYAEISNIGLGRGRGAGAAGERRAAPGYLLVERDKIEETLSVLEAADDSDLARLSQMRKTASQILRVIGSEPLTEVLSAPVEALPALAAQLDKLAPHVEIDDHGYRLRTDATDLVRDVFGHLLRNAMDHGLETGDERLRAGKTATGTLSIGARAEGSFVRLNVSDDGRGLALHRIRAIAVERGWIRDDANLDDEEIAQFILRSGFSTAELVTDISGRGVGMDAVNAFLSEAGGRLALRFKDNAEGAAYRSFEWLVYLPRRVFVEGGEALSAKAHHAVDYEQALDSSAP